MAFSTSRISGYLPPYLYSPSAQTSFEYLKWYLLSFSSPQKGFNSFPCSASALAATAVAVTFNKDFVEFEYCIAAPAFLWRKRKTLYMKMRCSLLALLLTCGFQLKVTGTCNLPQRASEAPCGASAA